MDRHGPDDANATLIGYRGSRSYGADESLRSRGTVASHRGGSPAKRRATGPLATATDVFSTRDGHKKVEKDSLLPPDKGDGLMTISVENRIVKKDMWHEESLALERLALEGHKGQKTMSREPSKTLAISAKPDVGSDSSRKSHAPAKEQVAAQELTPSQKLAKTLSNERMIRIKTVKSRLTTDYSELGGSGGKELGAVHEEGIHAEGGEGNKAESSILAEIANMGQTIYDMNGLPYRTLNKGKGDLKSMSASSRKLLIHAAAAEPEYGSGRGPADSANNTKRSSMKPHISRKLLMTSPAALTGNALAELDKEQGVPAPPAGPCSEDGSSLKSLEYSQGIDYNRQELAWQSQLTAAAAAACDPEITYTEIGHAPEHFADMKVDMEKMEEILDQQTSTKYHNARSFIAKRIQSTMRVRRDKGGWEDLTDTHEFRLKNGAIEVRKKGTEYETEEQRQKRINAEVPWTKKAQNLIATYMGWNKDEPHEPLGKTAAQKRKELISVRAVNLYNQMHLCEQLRGQLGTVRAMAVLGGRLVVGCADGYVKVWKPYEELVHSILHKKSMEKTMTLLKKNFSLKESNMVKDEDLESAGGGDDDDEKAVLQNQQSDWILHQTMDHRSAVTAVAEVFMELPGLKKHESLLAVATRSGCLFLWSTVDSNKWECAREIRVASVILSLKFHEGRIIGGCDDGSLHAWRLGDMEHGIIEGHSASVWSLAWVDKYLFTGAADGVAKVWQHDPHDDTYEHLVTIRSSSGGIWSIAHNTEVVTTGDDENIHVIVKQGDTWDLKKTFKHGHRYGPCHHMIIL